MSAYYNELDPYPARWLENLIAAGHIAPGVVDARDILDLSPEDVRGATQAHFFAGIGVWSAALRLAGWPDDAPLWTGSCPCQPFSAAGRGGGFSDRRHLWPGWFGLVRECLPPVIVGEQVASPAGLGWLDVVLSDLEGAGYACGAADLCAAGVGAPHIRQRIYFVAARDGARLDQVRVRLRERGPGAAAADGAISADGRVLGDAAGPRLDRSEDAGADLRDARTRAQADERRPARDLEPERAGATRGVEDTDQPHPLHGTQPRGWRLVQPAPHATDGFWSPADWIPCLDGRARPVEPGTFPLAHGATSRVGRLRAYGNAIVRQQAQAFIEVVIDMLADGTAIT